MAIIDASTLPNGTAIEADLVIIGGGMAGIAIAKEWAGANKTVAILESGGHDFDQATQNLYLGTGVMRAPDNPDRPIDEYLVQSRYRGLGGSGNIWGGKCVPLDEADFTARDWMENSGWPMSRAELQPFYDRASRLLEVPLFNRDYSQPQEDGRRPLHINGGRTFFSAPRAFTRFTGAFDRAAFDTFRTDFTSAPNINVYLNANVTEIKLNHRRRDVAQLDIACLNGLRHTAQGRAYVLATGGIENARLLLASRSVAREGVGNGADLVGRFFMGHVTYSASDDNAPNSMITVSEANRPMTLYTDNGRDKIHCVIAAGLEGQRRLRTGNFTVTLSEADHPPGGASGAVLALSAKVDRGDSAAPARPLPVFFMSEQAPNRESRITLDEAHVDALGMPRVHLEWVYTARDYDALEQSIAALATELGGDSKGRACWPVARSTLLSIASQSRHHVGTTRMHRDPAHGVVDANCRMHGVSNLYVAGSSVFPTAGIANPTLTLIALAMRMSDLLKTRLGAR